MRILDSEATSNLLLFFISGRDIDSAYFMQTQEPIV